jgi:hypothetical protein
MALAVRVEAVGVGALVALLAVLALALAFASLPAQGAFPGKAGLIVFDTSRQSGGAQSEEDCSDRSTRVQPRVPGSGRGR